MTLPEIHRKADKADLDNVLATMAAEKRDTEF
jgi:hypothetical protein